MTKRIIMALCALATSVCLVQAKTCEVQPKGSEPVSAVSNHPTTLMVGSGLDAHWPPDMSNVTNKADVDLKTCIELCNEGRQPGASKYCWSFGYQETLRNCDLHGSRPLKYVEDPEDATKGKTSVGTFGITCEEYVKKNSFYYPLPKPKDCCDLSFN